MKTSRVAFILDTVAHLKDRMCKPKCFTSSRLNVSESNDRRQKNNQKNKTRAENQLREERCLMLHIKKDKTRDKRKGRDTHNALNKYGSEYYIIIQYYNNNIIYLYNNYII